MAKLQFSVIEHKSFCGPENHESKTVVHLIHILFSQCVSVFRSERTALQEPFPI